MRSISLRLFAVLTLTTGLVWLIAALWIDAGSRVQLEEVLDSRLVEAARMVDSLIVERDGRELLSQGDALSEFIGPPEAAAPHFTCQIWSATGQLIGRSAGAPEAQLSSLSSGFTDTMIEGQRWRVFAIENEAAGIRILMADNLDIRDALASGLVTALLLPGLLIIAPLAGLIWLCVRGGLRPLRRLADDLEQRGAGELSPVDTADAPSELKPMMVSLNALFGRVGRLRERERTFTAFAAHELRTPLAGLKAQAEIAVASRDEAVRTQALGHVVTSVTRIGRLLHQLLDLAEVEADDQDRGAATLRPDPLLRRLWREGRLASDGLTLEIDRRLAAVTIAAREGPFELAFRNILENAVSHSPANGIVSCSWRASADGGRIEIVDQGPGVAAEELPRLTERFFRGRRKTRIGSGLGLSIAELCLERAGCRLSFANAEPSGLEVSIHVPAVLLTAQAETVVDHPAQARTAVAAY